MLHFDGMFKYIQTLAFQTIKNICNKHNTIV